MAKSLKSFDGPDLNERESAGSRSHGGGLIDAAAPRTAGPDQVLMSFDCSLADWI